MKSKSKPSNQGRLITNSSKSSSYTHYLKSNSSMHQWYEILSDIDAITTKVKQISDKQIYSSTKLPSKRQKQGQNLSRKVSITKTSIFQNYYQNSQRKKCLDNNVLYSKSVPKNTSNNISRKNSEKIMKKNKTRVNYCSNKNISNSRWHQMKQSRPEIKTQSCNSMCHSITLQICELKRANEDLLKKNKQLQKQLKIEKEQNKIDKYRQKAQKNKENEIILKIIKQSQPKKIIIQTPTCIQTNFVTNKKGLNQNQIWQPFSIQLKSRETEKINPRKQQKKQQQSKGQQQNNLQKQKDQKGPRNSQLKNKILNLSKQQKDFKDFNTYQSKIQDYNSIIPLNNTKVSQSQVKTLQSQFDRLMQISHLERNKTKKRLIWDQMKSIANKLKLIKSFTEH